MGWMNDTLTYIKEDPLYRKYHHNKMTFSMAYNYSENFILSISHDEVVHGKGSLVNKMWGDYWNKFAGLRLYLAHMMGHPGKKLMFSIFSFIRHDKKNNESLVFVCNYTPVVRYDFRIGVPKLGEYVEDFNTDNEIYGGSGQVIDDVLLAEEIPYNNQPYSVKIKVPPMAAIVLKVMNNKSK